MTNPPIPGELPAPRPCLLLVDDTPANIDVLVGVLKDDYELKVANRGAKAIKILESESPVDLVLLDVMMPELNGFEVCRAIRANPKLRDVPIIFLTARTELDDIVHGFEIGANDYLTKPFRPPELKARVRTHLTLRLQRQEIARKNSELQEMLHIICHDVGNNFAVLGMAMDIVRNHPEVPLSRYMPGMDAAVKNGVGLTQVVRDLRRIDEKGLSLERVPLREALDEAILLAAGKCMAKELAMVAEVPAVGVLAERFSLVNSVFGNLLSNAAKFSPRGSQIVVSGAVEDDAVVVRFRDRGVGMSPAILEALFDVVRSRSHPGTEGEKGTGFGMPLMRRFMTGYGGSVEVISRDKESHPEDHGSEFILRFRKAGA